MKDYNPRSRDIYGEPEQRRGRGWWKLGAFLAVAAVAAVAFFQFKEQAPAPEATPAGATNRDIIPLTLPPRGPAPVPAGPR